MKPDDQPIPLPPAGEPPQRIDLGEGEEVVVVLKPHWIFVLLDRPFILAFMIALAGLSARFGEGWWQVLGLSAPVLWIAWQLLERASRTYVLTDRRVVMIAGLLRQVIVDAPLTNVRQVSVFRTIPERFLDLGTLSFATAGTAGEDVIWRVIARPAVVLRRARDTLDDARALGGRDAE